MLVSTLVLILSTAISAASITTSSSANNDIPSLLYPSDAMSRGIEPLDKSAFVQSYADYYRLRQQMRAHASAVATVDDVPPGPGLGPLFRHLEEVATDSEQQQQREFTEECVAALLSPRNTDDRLISQMEFAAFLNGLTEEDAQELQFHNLYWTVSRLDDIIVICTFALLYVRALLATIGALLWLIYICFLFLTLPDAIHTMATDPSQVRLGHLHLPR